MPQTTLELTCRPELIAAPGKPSRLKIMAYNGGPMMVAGWGSVLIDLQGVDVSAGVPFLDAHRNALSSLLGQGEARVEGGRLLVEGDLAPTPAGRGVAELLAAGVRLQASVGLQPTKTRTLKAGEQITANGRTWDIDRPTLYVEAGKLMEVSLLPLGADPATSVVQGANMPDDNTTPDLIAAERARVAGIMTECDRHADSFTAAGREQVAALQARAIAEGLALDAVKAGLLDILRTSRPTVPGQARGDTGIGRQHVEAALLVRCGFVGLAEKTYGPDVMQQSRSMHSAALVDLAGHALRAAGREVPHDRGDLLRAAFSTGDMPVALSNTANKILLDQYTAAPSPWRSFALVRSCQDFKTNTGIRPTFALELEQLAPTGEIKHGSYNEEVYTWSVDTYAKMLSVSRQQMINDDLNAFSEVMPAMARAAARKLNDLVATRILANAGSFWSSGNGNYFEGAGTNLQASSLATALLKLRQMKDADGRLIDLMPRALYVPPELEPTALALINSTELSRDTSTDNLPTANAWYKLASVQVDPRLSDSGFPGYSATGWYLFSDPGAVVVGFLQGKRAPTVEMTDTEFNTLGVQMRVYHDFGVALADTRLAIKSKGAA